MTKQIALLIFIGLAWRKAEPDTFEIDCYQMGIDFQNIKTQIRGVFCLWNDGQI